MRRLLMFGVLALLLVTPAAYGQAQRGSVQIVVTDAEGGALPGALVEVASDQTLTRRSIATDASGEATAVALDPATNYVVTVSMDGFATQTITNVVVRAGQTQAIEVQMPITEVAEELIVVAEAPLVDVTKTQAGQDITLRLTESLPTARSYQDYLQLVPGVQDTLGDTDNPASRSGINYRDRDDDEIGDVGFSTDNVYYFDGINVTDRVWSSNGADMNTEIIQEQSVLTGAIPAEFVGAPGLISNVVTKSGGNDFSGSVNYYFQNDSLVEDNEHFQDDTFDTFDAAATFGGPIVHDKAWFYASFRQTEIERGVTNEDGVLLRNATRESDQGFGKVTWALTDQDVLSGTYLSDPTDQSGRFDRDIPNDADEAWERGGDRYSVGYNRVWGSAAIEAAVTDHEADRNVTPINQTSANTVSFAPGVDFSSAEETLGGAGEDIIELRGTESQRASLEYLFNSSWGDHSLKFGAVNSDSVLLEDEQLNGDPGAEYFSLFQGGARLCEVTGACGGAGPWSTVEFGASQDEFNTFRDNLTGDQTATLLGLWDDDGNGFLSDAEIANNMTFNSTAGNPNGKVNYSRDLQVTTGVNEKGSESLHYYIQDGWQWNQWSVNAGLRAEDTTFIASSGEDVGTFDTEVAPRVSVAYDLKGDGRSSLGLFFGDYYDAFRDTAIDFAGTLTGAIIDEQVFVDEFGEWITFRTRGGPETRDAFFANRIETPKTTEIQLQYKQDLGRNMMFEVNLIDRETENLAEDYGSLYYVEEDYDGDLNDPGSLFLGPGFFGFAGLGGIPTNLNFLIGTLPDEAFRDWQGVELIFRKRYSDNWQLLASYNYADADANTNSDGAFDGAGDVFFLDPRAINRTGVQPGLVENLFKVHGSYNWDNGFQVGGSYRWNSGIILNRNQGQAFGRSLPDQVDTAFVDRGVSEQWISPDAIGFIDGKSYGVLDARGSYIWTAANGIEVDFFLDVFNVLDDQQLIRVQDLVSGGEGFDFMEGIDFVQPRRYFLGARLRF